MYFRASRASQALWRHHSEAKASAHSIPLLIRSLRTGPGSHTNGQRRQDRKHRLSLAIQCIPLLIRSLRTGPGSHANDQRRQDRKHRLSLAILGPGFIRLPRVGESLGTALIFPAQATDPFAPWFPKHEPADEATSEITPPIPYTSPLHPSRAGAL
jgi:hypothetical protein